MPWRHSSTWIIAKGKIPTKISEGLEKHITTPGHPKSSSFGCSFLISRVQQWFRNELGSRGSEYTIWYMLLSTLWSISGHSDVRHRAFVSHSENPKIAEKLSHNAAKRVLLQNSLDMYQKRVPTRATGLVKQQPSRFHASTEVLRIYELVSVTRPELVTSRELFTNDFAWLEHLFLRRMSWNEFYKYIRLKLE